MNVGERIKQKREAVGITQTELAEIVGTTKQNIYKYESNIVSNIPSDKIEAIAQALHTTPAYLMGWDNANTSSDPIPLPPDAEPLDLSTLHRIPILGQIAAGMPMYAEENIEGYTYTELNGGHEYFALRVRGDSMTAARINDGDIIIVRKQSTVDNGDMAVVMVDMECATVKRFYQTGSTVTLMPQSMNPAHKPQVYDLTCTNIEILGKVVKVEFML